MDGWNKWFITHQHWGGPHQFPSRHRGFGAGGCAEATGRAGHGGAGGCGVADGCRCACRTGRPRMWP